MDYSDIFCNAEIFSQIAKKIASHYIEIKENKSKKRARTKDFSDSNWGKLLDHPEVDNPSSPEGKLFLRRFRIPFPLFEWIVLKCKFENIFQCDDDLINEIPVEIKVLCCLRILGSDNYIAEIDIDMEEIDELTINNILHLFLDNFSSLLEEFVVPPPINSQFLADVMNLYDKLGFTGCIGSMDVTHIKWNTCPKRFRKLSLCNKKFSSLAFNCVVDHSGRIHHCSRAYYGSINNKTLTNNDSYCVNLEKDGHYNEVKYILYDKAGIQHVVQGCYVLSDGKYRNERCYMDSSLNSFGYHNVLYSEILQSVKRDVKCTFETIKQRFRILKNGISNFLAESIQKIMYCLCILHNMILMFDEEDISDWENNVDWSNFDPDLATDDNDNSSNITSNNNFTYDFNSTLIINGDDSIEASFYETNTINGQDINNPNISIEKAYCNNYLNLKNALKENYQFKYSLGLTYWPKNILYITKKNFKLPNLIDRVSKETSKSFYIAKSTVYNVDLPEYDNKDGLFSHLTYLKGEVIISYKGEYITLDVANKRISEGNGSYIIKISNDIFLDCYETRNKYICLASFANSSTEFANADLVINAKKKIAYLKAKDGQVIRPDTEILVDYGNNSNYKLNNYKK